MSKRKAQKTTNDLKAIATTRAVRKTGRKSKAKPKTKPVYEFDIAKLTPALKTSVPIGFR
jgi:hypothetical protein